MYFNNSSCDIYIGKGAGKMLLKELRHAKKSVKIVSPFLSPLLVTELIQLHKRNVQVELITTDDIEDYKGQHDRNIHQLILQNRITDQESIKKRAKWEKLSGALTNSAINLPVIVLGMTYYFDDLSILLSLIPLLLLAFVIRYLRNKISDIRIYTYWYNQLFPFRVYGTYKTTGQSVMRIHSKMYIIDDEVAYLGSLNFTQSGTKFNHETRIRITDTMAVNEIVDEFNNLLDADLPLRDIQVWGSQLYREPIN